MLEGNGGGSRLDGILDNVYEDLAQEVLIGMDNHVPWHIHIPTDMGEDVPDGVAKGQQVEIPLHGLGQQGQLSVAVHKGGQSTTHVADGADTFCVWRPLYAGLGEIGLGYAGWAWWRS